MVFAAYIPVGPRPREIERAADLIDSLTTYCPEMKWLVLVDDAAPRRQLPSLLPIPRGLQVVELAHPREGQGFGLFGGLCVADLLAFAYVQGATNADFLLKIDTDSLVLAPFNARVELVLPHRPDLGLLGVIGDSFGPNRTFHIIRRNRALLLKLLELPEDLDTFDFSSSPDLAATGLTNNPCSFFLRAWVRRALSYGAMIGEYCQGGAYIVSRCMLDAMATNEYLKAPAVWKDLRIGEDVFVGLCCSSLGLRMYDFSKPGEVFAIHPNCLPHSCSELLALDRCIVHSLKGCAEDEFRQYFRERRVLTEGDLCLNSRI